MKAVLVREFGGPEQLQLGDVNQPVVNSNDISVRVAASALNRADTLQRKGLYPPPKGASEVLGLEMSGTVEAVGQNVRRWKKGDRVCGLLAGGGYAEYVSIHEDLAIEIPDQMSFTEAAAIPEVFLTAYQALSYLANLQLGESILIHAGASGVGTAAIQIAKAMGASQIIVTASKGKHETCSGLGANACIDYKVENFEKVSGDLTEGKGVDVIIDFLAASYFQQNINSLNYDGRMIMLALMGGIKIENLNVANILKKRLRIIGSTLRARSLEYKIQLTKDFSEFALPLFQSGELKPVIDSIYNWNNVAEAHRYMESNKNKGKIILEISDL